MKVGVLDKATTDFSVAEDLADPDSLYKDEAKFNLIKSLSKMGKDDDLAREYQDFVTNRPNSKSRDDLDFFLATHHFEKKGDPKTAQGFVKHLLDNYPDSPYYPQALFYGMRVSEKLKDFPTVDAYFSKMTTQYPNNALMPTVLYRYGDSLRFVKKDYKKSLSYFQRVVKEYPQHSLVPQALEEMGRIYLFDLPKEEPHARYAELASVLDQCITQYPDTKWAASARLLKATAQAETYQWKSAVNECNDALSKYGSDTQYNEQMARVTYMAGFCYEQQQDWDEAINAFQKTIDKYSEDTITADAQRELARCYYFQGNISMAYQATLKIIDQYPDTLAAAQAKQSLTHLQQLLAADTVATAAKETAQVKAPVFPAANLCGPVALQYVLTCHGIPADIPELMETSDYNGKGTNFAGLAEAARKKGLQAEGYQLKYSTLAKLDFPLIVQLKEKGNEHFVAITRMDNGKVYYYDQKGPHQVYSFKEFKRLWSGYALAIHGGDTNLPNAQMAKADSKLLNLEEMESISGGYQALAAQSDHTQMCGNGNGEGEGGFVERGPWGTLNIRPQRPAGHASTGMFANGGKGKGGRVPEQLGVNLGRGNTYTGFTTVSIPVQGGLTIDMCHYYQSNWHFSPYTKWDNPWGRSWHINHDMMLTFMSVNTVLFFKESGNFVPLAKSGNGTYYTINNKDLGYTFPEKLKMTEGGSGKPFLLENKSGRLYAFDTLFSSQTANIIWYSNYAGATVRYYYGMSASYPNTYGKVTAVLDNNGHGLFMQYSLPVGDFAYRLTSVKDHTGRIYYYAYDNLVYGALKRITYPDGYYVEYGYDTTSVVNASWAEITSTRDATSGDTILYKYEYSDFLYPNGDPGRRLARVTDMNGNTAEYAFDEWWYYTTVTLKDNAGTVMRTASVQYDVGQHAALRTDWSDGNHEYYTWDGILNPTSVTDRLGQAYNYGYDSLSNMTSMQKPNGDMQYWYYDTSNWYSLMTSSTDSLGNGSYYGYDAARRLLTWKKDPMGNVTQFTYDSYGNQITATDPLGNVTQYAYNQYGQKSMMITADKATTSYLYDALGNQTTVIDPLGNRTDYSYDLRNRVIQIQNAQGSKTQFQYALNDLLKKKTDANGNQTIYSYDLRGRLIQETDAGNRSIQYMYDRFDNLTCRIDARGYQSSYFYDSLSRLTARRYYNGTTALYYYDTLDRMTAVYDPCLGWSYMSYDALGRMTGNVTPAGSFNYSYDAQGNRTGVKNADGSLSGYYYNAAGKQFLLQNYVNNTWAWNCFDGKGRTIQSIYPNGIITQYQYNVVDRVTDMNLIKPTDAFNRSDSSSIGSSWSEVAGDWSIQGNQLYINNGSGINLLVNSSYGYLSNPVMEATFTCHTAFGAQNGLFIFGYTGSSNYYYAGIGVNGTPNLVIGQCLNGYLSNLATVNYSACAEYPVRLRLVISGNSISLLALQSGVWKEALNYQNSVKVNSGWVGLSSFYSQTHFDDLIINNNTSTFATYHYDYDLAGNRIDLVETGSKRTYYTYDGLNQLTREYRPYSPVTYDKYYQYDKVGNRTSTVINGTATAYSYDCMNQLSASTSGSTVFCFNYDANGNLLQRGPTPQENYTWNEDNHLTQYHFGTAPYSAYYTYDVFGRLAKRNYVSTENKYLYDQMSNNILMEKSGSSVANAYILNDQPVGQVYSSTKYGTEYFYHYDPAGTLLLMTSASGDTVSAYIHDSFGNMVYSYGSLFYDAHMYGQPLDSLGGFYIMGGRSFFEPELGVFLNKKETSLRGADYILNEHNPFSATVPQEILD
jgi:YD repeat-containing protein